MAQLSPFADLKIRVQRCSLGKGAAFEWLTHTHRGTKRMTAVALALAIALALLTPLGPLAANRFHPDEAVYSSWGLDIASGRDLLVSGSPVDKPPLFFYVQALSFLLLGPGEVAARLPSLIANVVSVGLVYALGRSLYGRSVGLVAAVLFAASPFAILFAPTAFTDPMMVAWVLAGCLAMVQGNWGWAGLLLGLATITKLQGVLFVPLALGLGLIQDNKGRLSDGVSRRTSQVASFGVSFLAVLGLALIWDLARARRPGFLIQGLLSYGGLSPGLETAWAQGLGFVSLLRYGTGSPVLNLAFLIGLPLLLVADSMAVRHASWPIADKIPAETRRRRARADLILVAFALLFLAVHALVASQVWDRYLLGLIPVLALLLARVLTLPWQLAADSSLSRLVSLILVLVLLSFVHRPVRDAAAGRFPVGGDHGAYQGIQQVVNYFQAVPADTTLYHRWLGWHWRFYLWGHGYDLRAWTSPTDLAAQAAERPGARRYIVFPSWRSATEARLALADAGLDMREVQRAFREDGTVSFVIYRIEEAP